MLSFVSVLINGSSSQEFIPTKGLRPRVSIAHFLFLVIVRGWTGLVRKAVSENRPSRSFNAQFVDHTLVVCEATKISSKRFMPICLTVPKCQSRSNTLT